ncbi:hypothetical protein RIF29_25047 [Crotalaria pallida]|uniref:Reverse transcriptase zinc-binding domain-containing protein n=1 Tax=Crotalaria pallida TaxID=3830 RepID=A0AAN9EQX3_CROPI
MNESLPDVWVWKGNISGEYSVKAGYLWLKDRSSGHANLPGTSWSWIWKLKIPENVKFLVWLACHGSLLTNAVRARRGMSISSTCSRCNEDDETIWHCLRDCSEAKGIWISIGLWASSTDFVTTMDLELWFRLGDSFNSPLFFAALWWIWRSRNSFCMEQVIIPKPTVMSSIHSLLSVIRTGLTNVTFTASATRWIRWEKPPAGLLRHIYDFKARPWELLFKHTLREGNSCADLLAKRGASNLDLMTEYLTPPPELATALLADCMEIALPRI